MLNNLEKLLEILESIKLEKRPILKMKVLGEAMLDKSINKDLLLVLSLYTHNFIRCPKPRWKNSSTYTEGQCKLVITNLINNGISSVKDFHDLPLKIQLVVFYSSIESDIGLNTSQLLSTVDIMSKESLMYTFGFSDAINEVDTFSIPQKCPMCGTLNSTPDICKECLDKLILATAYRIESFEVYGTNIKDFDIVFRDWKVVVSNNLFKFSKLTESITRYEPELPFREYQKTLQLI